MSPPNTHSQDQYPKALEVLRQIINTTEGERCIFRGESALYEHPCSSTLYRQLKKENATPRSIPGLLKRRQNELIRSNRKYKKIGDNDLEKLMWFRHHLDVVNLLDFTKSPQVALYFACFEQDKLGEDGCVIIKRRSQFKTLETEGHLPDEETVLLEPHEGLDRARDQHGVFLHIPEGFLRPEEIEVIPIKGKYKQEILNFLGGQDISDSTIFRDPYGELDRRKRENERLIRKGPPSENEPQGFAKSKNNQTIYLSKYVRLLTAEIELELKKEYLHRYANILIDGFTKILQDNPRDGTTHYNLALVYLSKPNPNYKQAILEYNQAISLNSSLVGAYINRGLAYAENPNPDYDRAISDYSHSVELSPDNAIAYYNRGNAYAIKPDPDYEKAILDYDRAIKLDPNYAKAYYNRGLTYGRQPNQNHVRAIADHYRALDLNPHLNWGDFDRKFGMFLTFTRYIPGFLESSVNSWVKVSGWVCDRLKR